MRGAALGAQQRQAKNGGGQIRAMAQGQERGVLHITRRGAEVTFDTPLAHREKK